MKKLSIGQLSDLTGRAWRTVKSRLEALGVPSVGQRGNATLFDSAAALAAVYAVEQTAADGELDLEQERARLAAAQAEKYEHENAIRRRQLAWMPEVDQAVALVIGNARARLLGIGPKLGPQLVNITDPAIVAAAISAEIREALAELAAYDPADKDA